MKECLIYCVKRILKCLLKVFYFCPVKRNRIVFFSYYGKGYSCNPKALTEYLLAHYAEELDIWWQFLVPENYEELRAKGIRLARYNSLHGIRNLMTAKVVVSNVDYPIYMPFRKSQYLVNTWHGGGAYKKVGLDMKSVSSCRLKTEALSKQIIDLYISSSQLFTKLVIRGAFRYDGEVLECGMPRNDMLLGDTRSAYREIRQKFHLPAEQKIVLYAPTFRDDWTIQDYGIDFAGMCEALAKRFGGQWVCFFRAHSNLYSQFEKIRLDNAVLNVSEYGEMQELLGAADVLITDYSSSMWDFSLMKKPCFIYAPDKASYRQERDFYVPMEQWPFPVAEDNHGLIENILSFNEANYVQMVDQHHKELGNRESGEASRIVADRILKECGVCGKDMP